MRPQCQSAVLSTVSRESCFDPSTWLGSAGLILDTMRVVIFLLMLLSVAGSLLTGLPICLSFILSPLTGPCKSALWVLQFLSAHLCSSPISHNGTFHRIEAAPRQEVMTFDKNELGPAHPPYKAVQTD